LGLLRAGCDTGAIAGFRGAEAETKAKSRAGCALLRLDRGLKAGAEGFLGMLASNPKKQRSKWNC
jgi:hypothetical protein